MMSALRLAFIAFLIGAAPVLAANQPPQPDKGPGGKDYAITEIAKSTVGQGSGQAFIFRPAGAAENPRSVIVFLHAWGAVSPMPYGQWIGHLVRKGHIVIYPRYQELNRTRMSEATGEAAKGVREALKVLKDDAEAKPRLDHIAVLGHGAGAVIAVNLAATAKAEQLPAPRMVMGVTPVRPAVDAKTRGVPLAPLADLPPDMMMIMLTAERDTASGEAGARRMIREASGLPAHSRLVVRLASDNHGVPGLLATQTSAAANDAAFDLAAIPGAIEPEPQRKKGERLPPRPPEVREARLSVQETMDLLALQNAKADALDYYGFWKTFDMAMDTAFQGQDTMALRRDARFFEMGLWSDGWPVKRLNVESPKEIAPAQVAAPSSAAASPQKPK